MCAVAVPLLVTLALSVGMIGARTSKTDRSIANNTKLSLQALWAAEAGALHALHLMEESYDGSFNTEVADGVGGSLAAIGATTDFDGTGVEFRMASFPDSAYFVRVIDNIDEAVDDRTVNSDRQVIIRSRGRARTAERVIEIAVRAGPFGTGLFGRDKITLSGGCDVDSYDSSAGAYGGINVGCNGSVGSNGDITLSDSGVTVSGNLSTAGTLSGGAVLTVSSGPVNTYVTEKADMSAGTVVNSTGEPGARESN